jgi:hypothetical protein
MKVLSRSCSLIDALGIVVLLKIFSRNSTMNCSLEMQIAWGIPLPIGFEAVCSWEKQKVIK